MAAAAWKGAMTIHALLTLAAICLSAPALAQQPAAADAKSINDCLEKEPVEFGAKCVGIIADPCIKALDGKDDQPGTKAKACAGRELAVWQKQLDAQLKRVNAGGFKPIIAAVAKAQKSWADSVNSLCPVFNTTDMSPSMGGANYCRLQETAIRVLLLRRLGDDVNEH